MILDVLVYKMVVKYLILMRMLKWIIVFVRNLE